jgi:hypothetical protein
VHIVNSLFRMPAIDARIRFSPDGNGGFTAHGVTDAMPSLEAYYHRRDGTVQTITQQRERGPIYLFPFMPDRVF